MNFWNHDLWYAIRKLRHKPGFTLAVVLTLAVGVGANLAVFVVFYGVLLRPLPFPQPKQLVRIERSYVDGTHVPALSGTMALYLQRTSRTLASLAAFDYLPENANLVQSNDAVPVKLLAVTPDFFRVFEMEPRLGRDFTKEDGVLHGDRVAVISDSLWRQSFAADPNVIGRSIILGSEPYSIIGVAPAAFRTDSQVDVWTPLFLSESPSDQAHNWNVVARMRPGVTYPQLSDDLKRQHLQLKDVYPNTWDRYESIRAFDFQDSLVGDVRPALTMLMGAVALLLLIVVANILSLLLTRSISLRPELSLRAALGASSWRLLRQTLVENAMLCTGGGLAGIFFADLASQAILHLNSVPLPQFSSIAIDAHAIGFTALLTAACALLFSLVPAIEARRNRLDESLRLATTRIATGRHVAHKALVVSEVAVSLVLLFAAALLLNSFWRLSRTQPGFDSRNVLTFKNSFSAKQYANTARLSERLNDLTSELEAIPGVEAAAAVNSLPAQLTPSMPFEILGHSKDQQRDLGSPDYIPITAHFFDVLRVPILAGRSFTVSDKNGSTPVVIINGEVARTAFKGENPIGQHILIAGIMGPQFRDSVREIVGVAGDIRQGGLDQEMPQILYLPEAQIPDGMTNMNVKLLGMSWMVRTKPGRTDVASQARQIFVRSDHAPLLSVEPLADVVGASIAQQRFNMLLLCGFGLISLVLGAAGLYGVMSYTLAQRTKEIGVRIAVGAKRGDIQWMVLREAGLLVGLGVCCGIAGALAGERLLHSFFFGMHEEMPLTLASTCGILLLTGLASAWLPARRAASIEPIQALRME